MNVRGLMHHLEICNQDSLVIIGKLGSPDEYNALHSISIDKQTVLVTSKEEDKKSYVILHPVNQTLLLSLENYEL